MNLAQMLTGDWVKETHKIKCKSYDTQKARSARTRSKERRRVEIPELIKQGHTVAQIAEIYDRAYLTIRQEVLNLAKDGLVDDAIAKELTKVYAEHHKYETPQDTTVELRNKIYVFLCAKPMGYAEIGELTGTKRTALIAHMKAMEVNNLVFKTGKYPVLFFAVK